MQEAVPDATDEACQQVIAKWIKNGALVEEEYRNPKSRKLELGLVRGDGSLQEILEGKFE